MEFDLSSPSLNILSTCLSSSVTIIPSEDNLVSANLESRLVFNWCSNDGRLVNILQNLSMLLKLCRTEFIKHVFPRFRNPSRFLGPRPFLLLFCASLFNTGLALLGEEPPITGLLTARLTRGRNARDFTVPTSGFSGNIIL